MSRSFWLYTLLKSRTSDLEFVFHLVSSSILWRKPAHLSSNILLISQKKKTCLTRWETNLSFQWRSDSNSYNIITHVSNRRANEMKNSSLWFFYIFLSTISPISFTWVSRREIYQKILSAALQFTHYAIYIARSEECIQWIKDIEN